MESFSAFLKQADSCDATSLPPLVYALVCAGQPEAAIKLIQTTLEQPESPGRSGAPPAIRWMLKNGLSVPLTADLKSSSLAKDVIYVRSMLASGDAQAADFILALGSAWLGDPVAMSEAVQFQFARTGLDGILDTALEQVQINPMLAESWAAALRTLPISAKEVRVHIHNPSFNNVDPIAATNSVKSKPINNATRALLAAWFDLVGFDSLLAMSTIEPYTNSFDELGSAARIVALKALAIEQDLAHIERL